MKPYIFLLDIRPKSKANCDDLITAIKLISKFIFEIRYSEPKQNEAIKRKINKK